MGTDIGIALSLFTVLAPAGAIAFVSMAVMIVRQRERTAETEKLEHYLIAPLAVCMVGLIASATHLGTPSNALYVLTGWGRSPLSNEVVSALGFLLTAGMYWLASFSNRIPFWAAKVWLIAASVAAFWLISMISVVYSIPTILTWNSALVPYGLWSIAFATGPLLGVASLVFSGITVSPSYLKLLLGISVVGLIAGMVVFGMQNAELAGLRDSFTTADTLVPHYGLLIVAYGVLGALGIALAAAPLMRKRRLTLGLALMGAVLMLLGAGIIRVSFYALHMTVGL
jgi:anaerobic dimethyl sulfoxide reductase subunit C (anchor subunit)